jgi:hypothetical protein
MITLEEALGLPSKTEATQKQTQTTPHPPTNTPDKIDIIIDLMNEVQRLKQTRENVTDGTRKADNILKAEMYITQLTLSAYKIILDGLKEAAKVQLTQNNQTNIENYSLNYSEEDKNAILTARRAILSKRSSPPEPISIH